MRCIKHPRYKGSSKPKVLCDGCWLLFFAIHKSVYGVAMREALKEAA